MTLTRIYDCSRHCGKLSMKNPDQEVATAARGLQKARIDSVGLAFDEIKHCIHQPSWSENLAMIHNPLL
jgi:hypothetical protein